MPQQRSDVVKSAFDPARMIELARSRGLTQQDLAALIGANKGTISRWVKRQSEPSPRLLVRLAEALLVNPADLYRVDPERRDLAYYRVLAGYSVNALSTSLKVSNALVHRIEGGGAAVPGPMLTRLQELLDIDAQTMRAALARRTPRPPRPRRNRPPAARLVPAADVAVPAELSIPARVFFQDCPPSGPTPLRRGTRLAASARR